MLGNPIKLLTRYDSGESWVQVADEGSLLDGFATMCFKKTARLWKCEVGPQEGYDDVYCHFVVAHAFMEFIHLSGIHGFLPLTVDKEGNPIKPVFDWFCHINLVPESLIEEAWITYLED